MCWTSPRFSQRKVRLLKERKRERVLTFGEEHRYLSRATEPLADLAVLMLELALWPGEAFRIRAEDVYLRSHLHVAGTKTEGSDRDVPITARARRILEARLAARKSEHLFPLRVGNGFDQADDQRERRAPRG